MQLRPLGMTEIDMYSAAWRVQSIAGQAVGILSAIHAIVHRDLPPGHRYWGAFALYAIYGVARANPNEIANKNDNGILIRQEIYREENSKTRYGIIKMTMEF